MEGQELEATFGNCKSVHYLAYYHGFTDERERERESKTYQIIHFNHVQFLMSIILQYNFGTWNL